MPSCCDMAGVLCKLPSTNADLTAHMLTEVCHDVQVEPHLQPLILEAPSISASTVITQDSTHLDVEASGFWSGRFECKSINILFNPHPLSNHNSQLSSTYQSTEIVKKRSYKQRLTPLTFSSFGRMGTEVTTFYKTLASLLSV